MGDAEGPISGTRSKRQKVDKHGRFAALEKLKRDKGGKHKVELTSVENVYDEVEEKEYNKRVLERQADDWIVDDVESGYVEDGREIFDDDLDSESLAKAHRGKGQSGKKRKGRERDEPEESTTKGGNIRHMLMNMQTKKKKVENIDLDKDDALGSILDQLESSPVEVPSKPVASGRPVNKEPLFAVRLPPPKPPTPAAKPVPVVKIKEEPLETPSQMIEDCDSMDYDFSEQDLQMIDQVDSGSLGDTLPTEKSDQPSTSQQQTTEIEKTAIKTEIKTPVKTAPKENLNAESSWGTLTENLAGGDQVGESKVEVAAPATVLEDDKLPLTKLGNGDEVFRMFWWDAYEDPFKQPGVVYLFGKINVESQKATPASKSWISVCLVVRNIERHVCLLPRPFRVIKGKENTDEPVSLTDVYTEFNSSIAGKHKIMEFKSRPVSKKYAFSIPGVPVEADYLEVVYPGNGPILPADLSGETFSRVFGANTSSLETLLLHRRLKGPCWLDIKGAKRVGNPVSWCKLEAVLQDPDDLTVYSGKLPPPPLTVMTINLRISVNPKTMHNEIVMASCLVSPQFPADHAPPQPQFQSHFCILTRPSDGRFPHDYNLALGKNSNFKATNLHKVDSERALLSLLLTLIFRNDPDLLVGHDIANFDLPTLLHRIAAHKVDNWSRIGRLRRSGILQHQAISKSHQTRSAVCGRLVCDVKLSSQELIRARSYDLDTLCQTVLKVPEGQQEIINTEDIKTCYSTGASLRNLVCLTMQDAAHILRIMSELNAIPLALQITNIAGNVMSRTLMGGRSERNEFLLLHAFTERGYITPDKIYGKQKSKADDMGDEDGEDAGAGKPRRKKAAYSGGLVLEPKKGFYDNFILLMDFNSLYPSIIQEYNICFTTLVQQVNKAVRKRDENEEEDEDDENDRMEELLASVTAAQASPPGVLPTEIRKLVESRRAVKGILAKGNLPAEEKMQLNIRQMALKLTANSMYGCLGFVNSRFYAKHLAALVTAKGRDILMHTKTLVERMGLDVVYGDTDSIMINTRSTSYDEVLKLGFKVKGEVNKLYSNVELEVDGIFKYLLLLKKKKYAALTISRSQDGTYRTEQELKGLDIVRRDWAPLATEVGKFVLQLVLSDLNPDERLAQLHERLSEIRGKLERGEVQTNQLAVAKTLTRAPEQYSDKKGLPHVTVALRLNAKGGRKLKQGDTVHYVICNDGTNVAATQRAYHLDELKTNTALKVDVEYYLAHQVHPVVSRLVECLDGTDAVRIAECLGLDPANYRHAIKREEEEADGFKQISQFCLSEEERFKHCEKFKFKCQLPACGAEIEIKHSFLEGGKVPTPSLEKCSNADCAFRPVDALPYLQNCLALSIRKYINLYYEGWLVCEDPRCNARTRGLGNNFHKTSPICRKCKQGILMPEYSEHELHQQIYFFRHMFTIPKQAILKKIVQKDTEMAYLKLREQAEKAINISAYCMVDLTTLFKKLQTKKEAVHGVKLEPKIETS